MFWCWNNDIIYDIEWVLLLHDNNKPNQRINVTGYFNSAWHFFGQISLYLESRERLAQRACEVYNHTQFWNCTSVFVPQVTPTKYPISITDLLSCKKSISSFFWTFRFLLIIILAFGLLIIWGDCFFFNVKFTYREGIIVKKTPATCQICSCDIKHIFLWKMQYITYNKAFIIISAQQSRPLLTLAAYIKYKYTTTYVYLL